VYQQIVPLQEVYDLVGVTKMKEEEQRFPHPRGEPITAIIAAAGFEKHLSPLTQKRPQCLLDIKGKSYRDVTPEEATRVIRIGRDLPHDQAHGEFIGIMMASSKGINAVEQVYHELQKRGLHKGVHESPSLEHASLTDMLQVLIEAGQAVQAIFTYKGWMDVDSFEDYQRAWAEIS